MLKSIRSKYNLILLLLFITISCARGPVKESKFQGYSEIYKGQEANISWEFENADKVRVEGYDNDFNIVDSITVSPLKSHKYTITAYQDGQPYELEWRVYVRDKIGEPESGPNLLKGLSLTPSYSNSKYLKGLVTANSGAKLAEMKVMSIDYSVNSDEKAELRAILLDQSGNFLNGIAQLSTLNSHLSKHCNGNIEDLSLNNPLEKLYSYSEPKLNIMFAIDNSASADYNTYILNYLKEFTSSLYSEENIALSYFNHNFKSVIELQAAEKAFLAMNSFNLPPPVGLNALYKSAYNSLLLLGNSYERSKNLCIIFTHSADNSSILYKLKDVALLARDYHTPVYIIGIGNALETFDLRYLAQASGGRFYGVSEEDLQIIPDILKEIVVAQKTYYSIPVSISQVETCSDGSSELKVTFLTDTVSEKINLMRYPKDQYSKYQAISAYGYRDTIIDESFLENIVALNQSLIDNPGFAVMLIGHSSIEGNSDYNDKIALKRAQMIRRKLLELGASPNQILVKSEGSNLPVYFLQSTGWQQYFNRRVEVRWLDPALMPFEIVAGQAESEEQALLSVETWEARGYKSYFQRYLKNNFPIYRIKLWGYKTKEEAEKAITKLNKEYKLTLILD